MVCCESFSKKPLEPIPLLGVRARSRYSIYHGAPSRAPSQKTLHPLGTIPLAVRFACVG